MRPGVCLKVKSVGKPDAVALHVRFDERGWETGLHATAPVLDSTVISNLTQTHIYDIPISPSYVTSTYFKLLEPYMEGKK